MVQYLYKQKRSLELRWQLEYEQSGKYTLDMVRIDDKIREVITEIKLEENKIADRQNAIENTAAQVSVATQNKSYIAEIALSFKALLHSTKIQYTNKLLYNFKKRYIDAYSRRPRDYVSKLGKGENYGKYNFFGTNISWYY